MIFLTSTVLSINDWIDRHDEPRVRVLVVEDNAFDPELLQRQLRNTGMVKQVTFIPDAHQARELLGEQNFRAELVAIFLDIHLPGMSGIELLQHIRLMPGMESFPVIVMTTSITPMIWTNASV